MGSSARHSNGRKVGAIRARKGKRKSSRSKPASPQPVDTTAILRELDDGYSIAATAYTALVYAQDPTGEPPDLGDIASTLDHGLAMIRRGIDAANAGREASRHE